MWPLQRLRHVDLQDDEVSQSKLQEDSSSLLWLAPDISQQSAPSGQSVARPLVLRGISGQARIPQPFSYFVMANVLWRLLTDQQLTPLHAESLALI
jgi:hypothetical protein